ncbi:hypothetical protein FisN_1Hh223 [Fistulifera solaris]|uniref:SET domain-containing protein n=1 Tax=Fistulifera solaris TaxID=1519565 RepID=A0A1Z5JEH2_FISSO|nr:hypothetical protein FisN_1Hh223 [Fistulifera solaris]|eukprot:GAX12292.1 hypothetical protein FisN_1Hh223 [Fistulifera solaris]
MMAALSAMSFFLIMRVLALTSAYYSTTFFRRHVGVSTFLRSSVQENSSIEKKCLTEARVFEQLCHEVGVQPAGLLRLGESADGIRGLYLNRAVKTGDLVLSIPLNKCLRDDQQLPDWMPRTEDESVEECGAWALRLAACLMEAQKSPYQSHHSLWFSLLPNPSDLRSSLPIHWDDEIVQSTSHTAFTMAVDSAYFARAGAIQSIDVDVDFSGALDVIQTRTCRVQTSKGYPLRLLAPVFDLFNHASPATAEFSLENDNMLVVRAMADLEEDQHVCIDYGPSTKPAWNSLVSYGFITAEDEELAEVYLDGVRYEVGPDFIPEDMVVAASSVYLAQTHALDENVVLTPEIAMLLARRISDVAHSYSLPPGTNEGTAIESTPVSTISMRWASALRWNQHRILLKCSSNLQDWAEQQSSID